MSVLKGAASRWNSGTPPSAWGHGRATLRGEVRFPDELSTGKHRRHNGEGVAATAKMNTMGVKIRYTGQADASSQVGGAEPVARTDQVPMTITHANYRNCRARRSRDLAQQRGEDVRRVGSIKSGTKTRSRLYPDCGCGSIAPVRRQPRQLLVRSGRAFAYIYQDVLADFRPAPRPGGAPETASRTPLRALTRQPDNGSRRRRRGRIQAGPPLRRHDALPFC